MKKEKILFILCAVFITFAIIEFVKVNNVTSELKATKKKLLFTEGELMNNLSKLDDYKEQLSNIETSVQDLEESTRSQQTIDEAEDIESDISSLSEDMEDY